MNNVKPNVTIKKNLYQDIHTTINQRIIIKMFRKIRIK